MSDPNRIVERVERLLDTARLSIEEAKTIFDGAVSDDEDEAVLYQASAAFERFCDTTAEAFENDGESEPPPVVLIAMAHVLSEWFNERAPVNEAAYLEPALQVWKAMMKAMEPKSEGDVH